MTVNVNATETKLNLANTHMETLHSVKEEKRAHSVNNKQN